MENMHKKLETFVLQSYRNKKLIKQLQKRCDEQQKQCDEQKNRIEALEDTMKEILKEKESTYHKESVSKKRLNGGEASEGANQERLENGDQMEDDGDGESSDQNDQLSASEAVFQDIGASYVDTNRDMFTTATESDEDESLEDVLHVNGADDIDANRLRNGSNNRNGMYENSSREDLERETSWSFSKIMPSALSLDTNKESRPTNISIGGNFQLEDDGMNKLAKLGRSRNVPFNQMLGKFVAHYVKKEGQWLWFWGAVTDDLGKKMKIQYRLNPSSREHHESQTIDNTSYTKGHLKQLYRNGKLVVMDVLPEDFIKVVVKNFAEEETVKVNESGFVMELVEGDTMVKVFYNDGSCKIYKTCEFMENYWSRKLQVFAL